MITFLEYLEESIAHETAKHMGLQHYGFGRYGAEGHVTHHNKFGRLVKVIPYHHSKGEGELKHLEHIDDAPFNGGVQSVQNAVDQLHGIVHGDKRVKVQTKIDGSPSTVFNNKEVGSKSFFNKEAKKNTSEADIEKHHGHAPGLVAKLKDAYHHLRPIAKPGVTHQGDFLYSPGEVKHEDIGGVPHVTFQPNTIKYAIPRDSEMGQKVLKSKVGIAVHTKYDKHGNRSPSDESELGDHPDVFKMPVGAPKANHQEAHEHLKKLGHVFAKTPKESLDYATKHALALKTYTNHKVREGKQHEANADDFMNWQNIRGQAEVDKMKSEGGKAMKQQKHDALMGEHKTNAHHINNAFNLMHHINNVKHSIVGALNRSQQVKHFINGRPANPEGYVVTGSQGSNKLVDRSEFSKANFEFSKNR